MQKAGKEVAAFIVEAAEIADLDLDTAPDVSTQYREEWQRGKPIRELLQMKACGWKATFEVMMWWTSGVATSSAPIKHGLLTVL